MKSMTLARRTAVVVAALAALVAVPARAEAPPSLAPLVLDKARNWAEALAACDITRFLLTDPDVTSNTTIIAPGEGSLRILYPPLYVPPNLFYAPSMLQAFETLQARGEVDRKSVAVARFRLASDVLPNFRRGDTVEKTFLTDQMKLCNVLTDGVAAEKPKK